MGGRVQQLGVTVAKRFVVERNNLRKTSWATVAPDHLSDGTVRLRIDKFALTSNNITYAVFGDAMGYWQFFPTGDAATGSIPVWGFGSVVESRSPGVDVGERFYGYFPIAEEVVLTPVDVAAPGFSDGAEHRRALHPIYNRYTRCSADPGYIVEFEAQQALLRPLFSTSFLLDDFLHDNAFFGAETVILSSASSKTAYGTAFCLAQRRGTPDAVKIIGLTSPGNLEFTRSLGCYDEVLRYDDIASSLPEDTAVYVDMSGSPQVRASVHGRLGDLLRYSCAVGATHWDAPTGDDDLPGPRPVLFFVPDQAAKRAAQWGAAGLAERIGAGWAAFMKPVTDTENPWLTVVSGQGTAAIDSCFSALLDGSVPAREGHVLSV
ncbi:hypothetical protein NGTWS0302_02770 [Mycolicibacterium cyprinidarum]|uniref:DUF2855 domain-containing protein n=1 Tax=Mycolicibacterium cyprinidarum TaxID=2860311 RepID=A0ABQ4V9F6_9MYCO|nr:hypothetical protein NGTWS0302_02770 [Mycolicibacterium sp. NGTWS0302]GJF14080.1 hypothetical protein NGTWS1702_15390 [Mycolicibacterium sp. NGTWSNA01]